MFDRERCIDNIFDMAKMRIITPKEIEVKAKLPRGFFSELTKEGSTMMPTAAQLAAIAKQLGVGVDYLINSSTETRSTSEDFLLRFIERLHQQTTAGKLEWIVETSEMLQNGYVNDITNPLVEFSRRPDDEEEDRMYRSKIYYGDTSIGSDCYHCVLPDDRSVVYLNSVRYDYISEFEKHKAFRWKFVIEMYIVNQGVHPVCSTYFLREEMQEAVEALYTVVKSSMSNIGLGQAAKNIMSSFLQMTGEGCEQMG